MAKHEFGIMMNTPRQSERYDEYEPWKYECISVDISFCSPYTDNRLKPNLAAFR